MSNLGPSNNSSPQDFDANRRRDDRSPGDVPTADSAPAPGCDRESAAIETSSGSSARAEERAKRKSAPKSRKRGGALLERALERASSHSDEPPANGRDDALLGPEIGIVLDGSEPTQWKTYPLAAGARGIASGDLDARDLAITELRGLIARTADDLASVKAEQSALRGSVAAADATLREQASNVDELRLSIAATAANLTARDAEAAELRRDLAESRALSDRRAEETGELHERIHTLAIRDKDRDRELESLRQQLDAREGQRRTALGELESLRATLDETERKASQRGEEIIALQEQIAGGVRSVAERDARIDQLQRSLAHAEEALSMRSEELRAERESAAERERALLARDAELEELRSSHDRAERELGRRDAEIATLREAERRGECTRLELEAEIGRLAEALALRSDETEHLREAASAAEKAHEVSLAEQAERALKAEALATELGARIEALDGEITLRDQTIAGLETSAAEHAERERSSAAELECLRATISANEMAAGETQRDLILVRRALASHETHSGERDREIAHLRQQLATIVDAAHDEDREMAFLDTRIEGLEAELTSLRQKSDDLRSSLASAQDARREEAATAQRLRDELAAARTQLELREREASVSSPPTEPARELKGADTPSAAPDRASELSLLRERVEQRETEIETLHHVITASNQRNTALRAALSGLRDAGTPTGADAAREDAPPAGAGPAPRCQAAAEAARTDAGDASAPPSIRSEPRTPPSDAPAASGTPARSRAGWKLIPWRRQRELQPTEPETDVAAEDPAEESGVEAPAVTGPPSFGVPADHGAPVADGTEHPAIFHYWKRNQILSKLDRPHITSADDFFLSYLLDVCRRNPQRTNRIVSIGTGSHDLEVVLARRALDAGVANFNIHCLSEVPSTLHSERAIAAEHTILANLTLLQCRMETWPTPKPYALVILNGSLQELESPALWLDRIVAALEPGGRVLVHSRIAEHTDVRSRVATEIANEIHRLLPDRYRTPDDEAGQTVLQPAPADAPDLLRLLTERLGFEVFVAFGNVVSAFVEGAIGRNFDPASERDRSFIDQVASVDDGKIDCGLIPPTYLLAALGAEPLDTIAYRHWTPEFCLTTDHGPAAPGDTKIDVLAR